MPHAVSGVPFGPGGGLLLSQALCITYISLDDAVCAHLALPPGTSLLWEPLGLARALLAIARKPGATGLEALQPVAALREGELVHELMQRLEAIAWPQWVPPMAYARACPADIADAFNRDLIPELPPGITNPLLAARLVAGIRGAVFMRNAAPSLRSLLSFHSDPTPSMTWELWRPVRPGEILKVDP